MSKFKVGDRVRRVRHTGRINNCPIGFETVVEELLGTGGFWYVGDDGQRQNSSKLDDWELVTVGPVRERIVKEVVRGKYGRLRTLEISPSGVNSRSAAVALENRFYTQSDLREIASLISATADALDVIDEDA